MQSKQVMFTIGLMAALFLLGSAGHAMADGLPRLMQLDCHDQACLCKSDQANAPPHDKCWGWYESHTYNILKTVGEPLRGAEIAAFVTGGPSEKNSQVRGFELQALPAREIKKKDLVASMDREWACKALCRVSGWQTLTTFAAPVASGPKELVYWEGHLPEIIALRIKAPRGHYVDNSAIWLEY